jgi:hypothetical protein
MRYVMIDTTVLPREKAVGRKTFPADAQGGRFNSLPHALFALKKAFPSDRFILIDRETSTEVKPS